ncbi:hypothetical protein [Streptomyces sp. NPDC046909]|uniref:acyl-CoA-like ligand-binding transcription factor n=1 Tax=Streptomyces sp. NPDC046909 TaxID=3155617 RepID=UPI0033EEC03F
MSTSELVGDTGDVLKALRQWEEAGTAPFEPAPPGRWGDRVGLAERAVRGEGEALGPLRAEVRRLPEDEQLLDTPAAAGAMSYFLSLLRALGAPAQGEYARAVGVVVDRVSGGLVPVEHRCAVHNRMAAVLAELGFTARAREALESALRAARTPLETAYTLSRLATLEADLKDWPPARRHAEEAGRLAEETIGLAEEAVGLDGGVGAVHLAEPVVPLPEPRVPLAQQSPRPEQEWLDVRMRCASVLLQAERRGAPPGDPRVAALAGALVGVCAAQVDRWGAGHPRALEALVVRVSAELAAAESLGDLESMGRLTEVLMGVARCSVSALGARHPQALAARAASTEAQRVTVRARDQGTHPGTRSHAPYTHR